MSDERRKLIRESKRPKFKGRGKSAPFVRVDREWLDSEEFGQLSGHAVKLFFELARQYRGPDTTNGDLQAAWSLMQKRGWSSASALTRAKRELLETGWAIQTRQGGRNRCSLFALTVWPVDDCKGKHDEPPTHAPLHLWRKPKRNPPG
jgi:hypothetical protein